MRKRKLKDKYESRTNIKIRARNIQIIKVKGQLSDKKNNPRAFKFIYIQRQNAHTRS